MAIGSSPTATSARAEGGREHLRGITDRQDSLAVVSVGNIPSEEEQCGDRQELG
jgi:hypothetical protein